MVEETVLWPVGLVQASFGGALICKTAIRLNDSVMRLGILQNYERPWPVDRRPLGGASYDCSDQF